MLSYDADQVKLYHGNVLEQLRGLEPGSVQCVVTSPPYHGLRVYEGVTASLWGGDESCSHEWGEAVEVHDEREPIVSGKSRTTDRCYGGDATRRFDGNHQRHVNGSYCVLCGCWRGTLGNEPSLQQFVANIVAVFREVRRVLREDGCCWLNLGDTFCSDGGAGGRMASTGLGSPSLANLPRPEADDPATFGRWNKDWGGLKPKDLCLIPARVALALQDDGWWIRSEICWAKGLSYCPSWAGSVMPGSQQDRPTSAHEMIYLLTKRASYFYDQVAVREQASSTTEHDLTGAGYSAPGQTPQKGNRWRGGANSSLRHDKVPRSRSGEYHDGERGSRTQRDVWCVSPSPSPFAHFATFPEAIVTPPILASTSQHGACPDCGGPWGRVVEWVWRGGKRVGDELSEGRNRNQMGGQAEWDEYAPAATLGWRPTCDCYPAVEPEPVAPRMSREDRDAVLEAFAQQAFEQTFADTDDEAKRWERSRKLAKDMLRESLREEYRAWYEREWLPWWHRVWPLLKTWPTVPCVVLDPFVGSGTTALVARRLGRAAVGIDASAEYLTTIAIPRLQQMDPEAALPATKPTARAKKADPAQGVLFEETVDG